jgi:hypothetical protein
MHSLNIIETLNINLVEYLNIVVSFTILQNIR